MWSRAFQENRSELGVGERKGDSLGLDNSAMPGARRGGHEVRRSNRASLMLKG